ncbi:unnamed protein product [Ceratitis capitata]|uniref:(Mediterranean fruit fly) hypothetical protein n=1 Tax=Ceratitis capitata TaxID=7213 RepID=A0A811U562_CERCA|nr:unnamed protein product [Ceratitis capitata]
MKFKDRCSLCLENGSAVKEVAAGWFAKETCLKVNWKRWWLVAEKIVFNKNFKLLAEIINLHFQRALLVEFSLTAQFFSDVLEPTSAMNFRKISSRIRYDLMLNQICCQKRSKAARDRSLSINKTAAQRFRNDSATISTQQETPHPGYYDNQVLVPAHVPTPLKLGARKDSNVSPPSSSNSASVHMLQSYLPTPVTGCWQRVHICPVISAITHTHARVCMSAIGLILSKCDDINAKVASVLAIEVRNSYPKIAGPYEQRGCNVLRPISPTKIRHISKPALALPFTTALAYV